MDTTSARRRFAAWVLVLALLSPLTQAATLTVGSDTTSCDYTNLQLAFNDAADFDTIQIEAMEIVGASGSNFGVANKTVFLEGGFEPGCDGTRGFDDTVLKGGGADSVLEVLSSSAASILISQVRITNGSDDANFGGGLEISGDVDVTLARVTIDNNESERGGGIHIDGANGATLFIGDRTVVRSNTALRLDTTDPLSGSGGGLYCEGGATVRLEEPASISGNIAEHRGGGIYADDCQIETLPKDDILDLVSIDGNDSGDDGGGLYLTGADLFADGGKDADFRIHANTAGSVGASGAGDGGGLYATGGGSDVVIAGGSITENFANNGGGAFITDDAVLIFESDSCTEGRCQELSENQAALGAPVLVSQGARAFLSEIRVQRNISTTTGGSGAAGVVTSGGLLDFKNAIVTTNITVDGVAPGAILSVEGILEVDDSTFSDNRGIEYLFTGSGDLPIENSIFWDNDGMVFDPDWSGTSSLVCAVVPSGTQLLGGGSELMTSDPMFVDPPRDYHLDEASPVIDQCANITESTRDIDGQRRPQGAGGDPGADEVEIPIFADSFEGQ